MLRFAFWSLLILNVALFAYGQGYLGTPWGNDHEPERVKRQFNTGKLMVLTRAQAEAAAANAKPAASTEAATASAPAASAPATPAAPTAPAAPVVACTEAGPFTQAEARRFEVRLAPLALGERVTHEAVQAQDVTSWLVHIPPQASKEAADHKAAELRGLGVTNFFIMQGESALKWAISLGVFKTETGAQALLAQLNKQGVHSARITPRGPQTTHVVYRLRDLDAATRSRVAGFVESFDDASVKDCR